MKRLTLITLVVLFGMVVTACGGKATPAPAPPRRLWLPAPTAAPGRHGPGTHDGPAKRLRPRLRPLRRQASAPAPKAPPPRA